MADRTYRIRIVCNTATVERVYEVVAKSEQEAVSRYKNDEATCVEEEVTDWDDDSFDPDEPDIEEVEL